MKWKVCKLAPPDMVLLNRDSFDMLNLSSEFSRTLEIVNHPDNARGQQMLHQVLRNQLLVLEFMRKNTSR